MKKSLQSSLNRRARIAWQCVGLFLFLAGVAAAQEVQSVPGKQPGSLPPAATFTDRVSAVEQVQFDVVMVVLPYDGLDEWAKKHDADIKRVDVKSGQPVLAKTALQFEPEVRQALLTKLKGDAATVLGHIPVAVTDWGRQVHVDTGGVSEEEGGMILKLTANQIGKGELRLEIASEFRLSDELKKAFPPRNWNLDVRTRADNTILLPLVEIGAVQRMVLLIQPKIVAPVRATIIGTPQVVQPRRVTDAGQATQPVTAGGSSADGAPARAYVSQPATDPFASPRAGYPAPSGQQVQLEFLFAVVPDEVLMKWAIPHKAIIKRVHSNESRPTPLRKPSPAASRQFSLLFGSEAPVPLLFDAELHESLLTALKKDTRTKLLRGTSVMTAWAREVRLKTPLGVKEKTPLALRMLPTEIGKGELGLVIDAEVSSTPDVPGGMKSHWNLRARVGHTLMLPLAQPDLEKQLVLFVVPKIIAERPVTTYPTPQFVGPLPSARYQSVTRPQAQPVYPQQSQTVPQTSYRPVPRSDLPPKAHREMVAITADIVTSTPGLIPDRMVEFGIEQRKSWLKSLTESQTSSRQQMSVVTSWDETARLTPPRAKGKEIPFELHVTPKRGDDGLISLDIRGIFSREATGRNQEGGLQTTLSVRPNTTVVWPLAIKRPDGQSVALLIQAAILATSPTPVTPPLRAVAGTPEKDVATLQMLILDVDAKIAREVVSVTPKNEEKHGEVEIELPKEKGSKKRGSRKQKVETRSFVMNASLGKLFIADLKKRDESFKVVSRPQVRTLVGVCAALEVRGGIDLSERAAGGGTLKIFVTPKEVDRQLMVKSQLTLLGPGESLPTEKWTPGLKVEAESTQRGVPGETAVLMIGGKEGERTIILLTDLIHVEKGQPRPTPPVVQVLPVPLRSTASPQIAMQQWQQSVSPYAPTVTRQADPQTNMRLVTLQAMTGSGVANGDTVDVLLGYAEDGDIEKAQVELLCESVKVYESARASHNSTTSVTLLVKKDQVEMLLLGQLKGTLQLSVHKSSVQHPSLSRPGSSYQAYSSTLPIYGQPVSPYRGPIVYRENGTWGPPDSPIQASGVQSPQPLPKKETPKSEVQQVLDEVREMRKMIQGLRDDMNHLRNSVGKGNGEAPPQADLWIRKGASQLVTREKRIVRVDGFDTDVVGIHAKSANSVVVFGRRPGNTTVKLTFEGEDEPAEKIVVAVVTESPVGALTPLRTRPRAADNEPPLPGAQASPPMPVALPQGPRTELRLLVGQVQLLKRDRKVARIVVSSPAIADVTQYTPKEYGITGLKPGRTNIVVWYEGEAELPITVAVEVVASQPSVGGDPFSSTGSKREDTSRHQIEQALNKTVSIDMADGTLKEAFQELRETAGVNIVIDSVALEEEGVTTDAKVSLHLSGVSLRSALKVLLSPFNLTTLIEDEVMKVTSQVRAQGAMVAVVYQVRDLIQTDKDGKADFDSLIELVTSVVEPDSWQEVGGMGAVSPNAHTMSLVVRQTQGVHEEIQQLFAALRKWNPGDGPATSRDNSVQSSNREAPDALPEKAPGDTGAPIEVPRYR